MTCGKARNRSPGAAWFDNGVLVEPQAGAFLYALEEFGRFPERVTEMGQSARAFASARYSKEILIANVDSLYREMLVRKLPHLASTRRTVPTQV